MVGIEAQTGELGQILGPRFRAVVGHVEDALPLGLQVVHRLDGAANQLAPGPQHSLIQNEIG